MLSNLRHIYFLGAGGIGMSALARYFLLQGIKVSGYDKTDTALTQALASEGVKMHYNDLGADALQDIDLVVFTPAIPKEFGEYQAFLNSDIPMVKRAKILGEISKDYFTIAIAGTHGKTTITSMVAHFLNASGIPVNAFIGGIANNYSSNLILNNEAKIMVVEADEFDRSFLHLHPDVAIISSMDADHLDIYENKSYLQDSFFDFANNIQTGGTLIMHEDLPTPPNYKNRLIRYGTKSTSDFKLTPLGINQQQMQFEVEEDTISLGHFNMSMPGLHNLLNATAAIAASKQAGVDHQLLGKAISTYKGVKRRFEIKINKTDCVLIDDYAHHPTEIKSAIAATREMFAGAKIMGVFQPHLFSRTRDFADDFAAELSKLDALLLLDIYPARELPIEGIDSQMLLNKVTLTEKFLLSKDDLANFIQQNKYPVTLMMGAGDIDKLVDPIEKIILNNA